MTVRHADLAQPIRLTSDGIATVRSDGTYHPFPFRITLPRQTDAQDAGATLEADIVDRQIIAMLRAIDTAPWIDIEVIAAGEPEVHGYDQVRSLCECETLAIFSRALRLTYTFGGGQH